MKRLGLLFLRVLSKGLDPEEGLMWRCLVSFISSYNYVNICIYYNYNNVIFCFGLWAYVLNNFYLYQYIM